MSKFKVGDKVYYPIKSTKVLTIGESNNRVYPISVIKHDLTFTIDGNNLSIDTVPCLIHATPKNHKLLEQLYGIEFEKPPVKPTSREIIKAMLERGDKFVPCMAAIHGDDWCFVLIKRVRGDGYIDGAGMDWDYAKPIDPRTNTEITELPE